MRDVSSDALNAPSGRLAEVLLKKLTKASEDDEISDSIRKRLDRLIDAPGRPGRLARVRLASEVSYLFEQAPRWTESKVLPFFDWSSSPDAADVWSARKYSRHIGSPKLFGLMKQSFLELFDRRDAPSEDLTTFAEWLTVILIANKLHDDDGYPLTGREARAALRRAGAKALRSVGHRLAVEMERAEPQEKASRWRTVVGPVFQETWPLDIELQTPTSTFKLVQILRASGDAFSDAAKVIIPFIRPDDPRSHSTVFSIARAPEELYASHPSKMLDLIAAVVGNATPGSVYALDKALDRIRAIDPKLADTSKFRKLASYAASSVYPEATQET